MKLSEYVLALFILVVVVVGLYAIRNGLEKEKLCKQSGGVYLRTFSHYECVKVK